VVVTLSVLAIAISYENSLTTSEERAAQKAEQIALQQKEAAEIAEYEKRKNALLATSFLMLPMTTWGSGWRCMFAI